MKKLHPQTQQTTFQADLPSQFVYFGLSVLLQNVCRGCVKKAPGRLPAYLQKLSSFPWK